MKKILSFLFLVCFSTSIVLAQDSKSAQKESAGKAASAATKEVKADAKTAQPAKAAAVNTATPTKKDGTPDMRYKENKEAAKAVPAGPTKKDGTPDMRYKENKEAGTKK